VSSYNQPLRREKRWDFWSQPLPQIQLDDINQVVWILPAKTGSTSVRHMINSILDERDILGHKIRKVAKQEIAPLKEEGYTVVMTVRDPMKRLISAWKDKFATRFSAANLASLIQTIPDSLADIHIQSQHVLHPEDLVDYYVKLETFREDIMRLKIKGVVPNSTPIPHSNKGPGKRLLDSDRKLLNQAAKLRYQTDFELYQHAKEFHNVAV